MKLYFYKYFYNSLDTYEIKKKSVIKIIFRYLNRFLNCHTCDRFEFYVLYRI